MEAKIKSIPEGYHSVTSCLTLKNSLQAIEFYQKAFGAKVLDLFPSPDGSGTMHATVKIGDSILMMGDEKPNQACKSAEALGASPVSLYLYVPNCDDIFKQALKSGATEIMPMADMFWGDRCGSLKDPFGYSWTIATHRLDLTPEQVRKGAESFFAQAGKN